MLPPSLGGPGLHAERLNAHWTNNADYKSRLFVFEKLNRFPAGLRHLLATLLIIDKSRGADIIIALDGFSVALPALLAARLSRKKIILRIGGDLVHEQYVETGAIDMEGFYKGLKAKEIKLPQGLAFKLRLQRFVIKHVDGVIFTSSWQKNIYKDYYRLPNSLWVIQNPSEKLEISGSDNRATVETKVFLSVSREVAFKNTDNLKRAFAKVLEGQSVFTLDTERSTREELLTRMQKAYCYVNVSLSDISPNTVLDALALGLPCILTKNTGFYEALIDARVCRFVDPFEQGDIEKALLEMADPAVYEQYKKNLKTFVWTQSWPRLFKEYEQVLSDILQ